jgi:hypothetical protein
MPQNDRRNYPNGIAGEVEIDFSKPVEPFDYSLNEAPTENEPTDTKSYRRQMMLLAARRWISRVVRPPEVNATFSEAAVEKS